MTTREQIRQEIEQVGDEYLDELHRLIQQFIREKEQNGQSSLLKRLKNIRIDGPEDFAEKHDEYMSGEHSVE